LRGNRRGAWLVRPTWHPGTGNQRNPPAYKSR
jgi:hypothetical protein